MWDGGCPSERTGARWRRGGTAPHEGALRTRLLRRVQGHDGTSAQRSNESKAVREHAVSLSNRGRGVVVHVWLQSCVAEVWETATACWRSSVMPAVPRAQALTRS